MVEGGHAADDVCAIVVGLLVDPRGAFHWSVDERTTAWAFDSTCALLRRPVCPTGRTAGCLSGRNTRVTTEIITLIHRTSVDETHGMRQFAAWHHKHKYSHNA